MWQRVHIIRSLVLAARYHNLDLMPYLSEAGVNESDLEQSDKIINWESAPRLWRIIIEKSNDPHIGLRMGSIERGAIVGLLSHIMECSPNLHAALMNFSENSRYYTNAFDFKITEESRGVRFIFTVAKEWEWLFPDTLRNASEYTYTAALNVLSVLSGHKINPVEVTMSYEPDPGIRNGYQQILSAHIEYGHDVNSVLFSAKDMKLPVIGYNKALLEVFKTMAAEAIAQVNAEQRISDAVRKRITAGLPFKIPSLEEIAAELHMTERTLQRKLKEENISYQQVLDETRHDMSVRLSSQKRFTITEISYMLGFSDPSAYRKAARRWSVTR